MDITVAIGRNVNDSPMEDTHWYGFVHGVQAALVEHGFAVSVVEKGTARYDATNEEHCRFWASSDYPYALGSYQGLRDALSKLAGHYKQHAIALSHVDTVMVKP